MLSQVRPRQVRPRRNTAAMADRSAFALSSGLRRLVFAGSAMAALGAQAQDAGAQDAGAQDWASGIKLTGQVDAGIVGNPQDPNDGVNFGQLFTDKANRPLLNQLLLTAQHAIDPTADTYSYGFKLQGLYGSDARIVHSLGLFDHAIHDRNQVDLLEANVSVHAPWLSRGGVDLKAGIYPTPLGFEQIDPKANPFYTHSYMFEFGVPFKHLGIQATWHVTGPLYLYLGLDSGTNTTVGSGDNNQRPGGIAGVGLNLWHGAVTVLALSHMGPEDSTRNTPFGNSAMRYDNDLVVTWKQSPKLTLTGEANYVREEGFHAEGYGATSYASYALSKTLKLNGRAEIWRDQNNFFVATPVNNLDFVNYELGRPANLYTAARPTTYSEFTGGVSYTPLGMPAPLIGVTLRPELRYDRALNHSRPFDDGRDRGAVTVAADAIARF